MRKLVVAALSTALILTSLQPTAAAQTPYSPGAPAAAPAAAPTAAPKPAGPQRDKGLMFKVSIGLDGCTDDWCDEVDPSVATRVLVLYRIMKYVAAGIHVAFLFGDPDNNYADRAWSLFMGAEGRGIFPYKQFDFWLSVALGYNRTMSMREVCFGATCTDGHSWMNAFAIGFGFGADYYITKNIGLGLNFNLYKPWPDELCAEFDGDTTCTELDKDDLDNIGVIWSINAVFTYYLPL